MAATKRREVAELIERVLSERCVAQTAVTFLGRNGGEFAGHLTLAPVLSDYLAHGVVGVFVRSEDVVQAAHLGEAKTA